MSNVTELIREAPAYKKAVLAVAVTAGVGACVYIGYRQFCGPQTSGKPRGPDKPREPSKSEEKPAPKPASTPAPKPASTPASTPAPKPASTPASTPASKPTPAPTPASPAKAREPTTEKEEHVLVKPEPVKIAPSDSGTLDRSVLTGKKDAHRSPLRSEELSSSVTFEKISLGLGESDNFEHVTLPQINPIKSSPARKDEEKGNAEEQVLSSSSFRQLQSEPGRDVSLSNPQDSYENLSMSQADPSISFISAAGEEQKREEKADKSTAKQTKLQQPKAETEEASGSSNDEELASAASVVSVKDENDIVVVETHEDDSEKSQEQKVSPRSGMASFDVNFDPSRVSPVFGQQTYQRVDTEPEELATFDPAKSHPASFGFKFGGDI